MPGFFCVLDISYIFVPQFLYWFLLALSAYFIMYHFNIFSDFFPSIFGSYFLSGCSCVYNVQLNFSESALDFY